MTDLQAQFSGTEEPQGEFRLDTALLDQILKRSVKGYAGPVTVRKFKGGQSNPTYLLQTLARNYVLRRQPSGQLVKSAHKIDREYRVYEALHPMGFPVPEPVLFNTDHVLVDTDFFIVQHLAGHVFWDPAMPESKPAERTAVLSSAVEWLAKIHRVDLDAAGLSDFGKAGDYASRNLKLWSDQYRAAEHTHNADMHWLMDALAERVPTQAPVRLIHGDYGLYNLIVDTERSAVTGILDWEMATLGDPYIDFAHHLRPWWTEPDPLNKVPTVKGLPLRDLGIPNWREHLEAYLAHMELSALPNAEFYLAFAQFRFAAMVQGILKRRSEGTAANRNTTHRPETVNAAARNAVAILRQGLDAFPV